MVLGMTEGWFTGKRFASYLPAKGPATTVQFTSTRRIINGIDRAEKVAGYAMSLQARSSLEIGHRSIPILGERPGQAILCGTPTS